jgi:hypothetical protein
MLYPDSIHWSAPMVAIAMITKTITRTPAAGPETGDVRSL